MTIFMADNLFYNLGIFIFQEIQVVFTVLSFEGNPVVGENVKEKNICHRIHYLKNIIFNFEN